jgi:hypothetical protein
MKTALTLFLLITISNCCFSQNKVTINFLNKTGIADGKLDLKKKCVLNVEDCASLGKKDISIIYSAKSTGDIFKLTTCPIGELDFASLKLTNQDTLRIMLTGTAMKGVKEVPRVDFVVFPDGTVSQSSSTVTDNHIADNNLKVPMPTDKTLFFDASLMPSAATFPDASNKIIYNPCDNTYEITSLGKPQNFLQYRRHKNGSNNGVLFLIKDFNINRYDITLTNEFQNNSADQPDIFKTVFDIVANGLKVQSEGKTAPLILELAKINKLNTDLKAYFASVPDCNASATDKAKDQILKVVKISFVTGDDYAIDTKYQGYKADNIKKGQAGGKTFDEDAFNAGIKNDYNIIPDTLVNQTKRLLQMLINTKYEYRYYVPQIQNADAITFTVNVKPKSGLGGTVNVVNQQIMVPIRGGLKVDFTTGVYYSTIRNEAYTLKANADSSHLLIVPEGGTKGTIGITGLMHVYSRLGSVTPSFVLGAGKTLDLNYSLLTGIGVLFGTDNKFAISGGANFSNIKALSNKYLNDDGTKIPLSKSVTDISTYNVTRRAWFISFTYSLGLTKKTQTASAPAADTSGSGDAASSAAKTDTSTGSASAGKTKKGK